MSDPMILVRRARPEDRARILEISSQIWDGDDYVPELIDGWMIDREGELAVAVLDNNVISFAHRTWLSHGIAWFEGIRTDPAWEGHGAARAITEHFIRQAKADGATRINLSTHIDNEASIHIIESSGFACVATFSYVERAPNLAPPLSEKQTGGIRALSPSEICTYVESSEFLALAQRRFPRGWRFFPFDYAPNEAIARLSYVIGMWEKGALAAALCIRQSHDHIGQVTINFLDGEASGMRCLLARAIDDYAGKGFEAMVPIHQGQHSRVLEILREVGFTSWSDFKPDVFAYEMMIPPVKDRSTAELQDRT